MKIVTEELKGCMGRSSGTPDTRYYVIKEPINNTGVCYQFDTREAAEAFISDQGKQKNRMNQLSEASQKLLQGWAYLRQHGAIGLDCVYRNDDLEVHMKIENFLEFFPDFEVADRQCEDFPHQLQVSKGGILFFALLTKSELLDLGQ